MAKRILIYGINYDPEPIGVGRYTGDLARFLAERGHDVTVVTAPPHYPGWRARPPYRADRYAREVLAGVRVRRAPLLLDGQARGIWRMIIPLTFAVASAPVFALDLFRRRPDVVLCVEPTLFSAPLALLLAKAIGARTVLHVQDLEIDAAFAVGHLKPTALLGRLAAWFDRTVSRGFDGVVTISEQMRLRLVGKGVEPGRLSIIRNWVDLRGRQIPDAVTTAFRAELGLEPGCFVVQYSGNIGVKQALPVVLEAARLLADDPRIVFLIGGEGPEKARLVAEYGSLPNVRFLPLQTEERLPAFLACADLHILPQLAGTADLVLPSKLGAALASGRPVLVTADPGTELHDFLGDAAHLVPAGDSRAVADALRRIAAAPPTDSAPRLALARTLDASVALRHFEAVLAGETLAASHERELIAS